MTNDLRARLATILRSHLPVMAEEKIEGCTCGDWLDGMFLAWQEHVAAAVIYTLQLREEWATEESLLLGIVKLSKPQDAVAQRIGTPWKELDS